MFFKLVEQKIKKCERLKTFDAYDCYCQAALEAINELIENNCLDSNEEDIEDSESILLYVIETENIKLVKILVESGADVNAQDEGGEFALLRTARIGWEEGFNYLKSFTSPDLRERAIKALPRYSIYLKRVQNYALEEFVDAAFEGNINTIRDTISQGIDINAISSNGEAALHKAIRMNHLSIVKMLLKAGANPNLKEEEQEYSPLMIALNWSNVDWAIFQALLEAGADINSRASRGETALMLAVFKLNLKAVEKLLELGADVNDRDISGNTALAIAQEMRKRNDEAKQEFITEGKEIVEAISVEDAELIEIIDFLKSYGATE